MILKKTCTKCFIEKPLDEFYKQKNGYLDRRADCKKCGNDKQREVRKNNINKNKQYFREYYRNNKEKYKEYYEENKEEIKKYNKEYYRNNKIYYKEYNKEYFKEYYKKNSKELNEYGKIWRKNNLEKCRIYARNRYKKNEELSAIKWMRNFLYRTEKMGFKMERKDVLMEFGYTPKQLILRIECQFKEGMTWENRDEWHIDHKKPISSFKKGSSPRIINMLSNLQPLWKEENLSKKNKFK